MQFKHLVAPLLHGTMLLGSLQIVGTQLTRFLQLIDLAFEALLEDELTQEALDVFDGHADFA